MIKVFNLYGGVFRYVALFLGVALFNRLTFGVGGIAAAVVYGINCMTKRKMGMMILCYLFIPFVTNLQAAIAGKPNTMVARLGSLVLTFLLVFQASNRRGHHIVPLGGLYAYAFFALISSIDGWCPVVSYFKIVNFLVFLVALHLGLRNIHHRQEELEILRKGLFAFCIIIILGSVVSIAVPSIGYSMELRNAAQYYALGAGAEEFLRDKAGVVLFSGLTNHSQVLGPIVAVMTGWVLADMMFIERRISRLHLMLLFGALILMYKSGSRVSLLGFVSCIGLFGLLAFQRSRLAARVKQKMRSMFNWFVFICIFAAIVLECMSHGFSKFVRKTSDTASDERGLTEAVTASRMGSVDMNMSYFKMNPIFGKGFQTWEFHQGLRGKMVFSAPIEKGVLPLMILGETGLVGFVTFVIFLISFCATCWRKRYIATMILFLTMVMENMGEAVFFSPAATGGVLWVISVAGGFVIDLMCITGNPYGSLAMQPGQFYPYPYPPPYPPSQGRA